MAIAKVSFSQDLDLTTGLATICQFTLDGHLNNMYFTFSMVILMRQVLQALLPTLRSSAVDPSLEACDKNRNSALHIGASKVHEKIVDVWLAAGPDDRFMHYFDYPATILDYLTSFAQELH
jgi:hypothetical protein